MLSAPRVTSVASPLSGRQEVGVLSEFSSRMSRKPEFHFGGDLELRVGVDAQFLEIVSVNVGVAVDLTGAGPGADLTHIGVIRWRVAGPLRR
jgi:hypothetical protein